MLGGAISLIGSVAVMILLVARRGDGVHMAYAHMGIAAIVATGFAVTFMRSNTALRETGARPSAVAAMTSRYVCYVWTWAALCLLTTYAFGIAVWREWLLFSVACLIVAGLAMVFASILQRDADEGRDDPTLLKLAHVMAIVLLAGMVATIIGLLVDGKMMRMFTPRFGDWPANNVFFFGALSVAAITGFALKFKNG